MAVIIAYIVTILLILFFSLIVMSSIEREHESLYKELGGMESMQLPLTHIRFFWFIFSGRYAVEIKDKFVRNICHILRVLELALLGLILFQMLAGR